MEKVALKVKVTGFGFAELTNGPDPDLSIVMGLGSLNVHMYSMIWLNKHIFSTKYCIRMCGNMLLYTTNSNLYVKTIKEFIYISDRLTSIQLNKINVSLLLYLHKHVLSEP